MSGTHRRNRRSLMFVFLSALFGCDNESANTPGRPYDLPPEAVTERELMEQALPGNVEPVEEGMTGKQAESLTEQVIPEWKESRGERIADGEP